MFFTIAVDSSGDIYVAEWGNNDVLKETPSGNGYVESTVGSGLSHPCGVAVDGNGNVYIGDGWNLRLLKETPSGSGYAQSVIDSNTPQPYGIALDQTGNVYFTNGSAIYKETVSGSSYTRSTIISAGGLNNAFGVAVHSVGNVYVADTDNNRVLKEPLSEGSYTQSTIVSSGLNRPSNVMVDSLGNVYITDANNSRVLKESLLGADFGTVAVGSTSTTISLSFIFNTAGSLNSTMPYQVLTQGVTGLDFADARTGTCSAVAPYSVGDTCTVDVTFTPKFAGIRSGAVVLQSASGSIIATAYIHGVGQGAQAVFGPGTQSAVGSGMISPYGVATDASGNVYIADAGGTKVQKVPASDPSCSIASDCINVGSGLSGPAGVAVALSRATSQAQRPCRPLRLGN